jgi:hypothetical protein
MLLKQNSAIGDKLAQLVNRLTHFASELGYGIANLLVETSLIQEEFHHEKVVLDRYHHRRHRSRNDQSR